MTLALREIDPKSLENEYVHAVYKDNNYYACHLGMTVQTSTLRPSIALLTHALQNRKEIYQIKVEGKTDAQRLAGQR